MTNPGLSGGRAMLELADRCEKATGPDRALDRTIQLTIRKAVPSDRWTHDDERPPQKPRHFTASIDAALTLVPEGCCVDMRRFDGGSEGFVQIRSTDATPDDADDELYVETEHCATLPLALTAAALRARAADTPSVKP